MTQLGLRVLEVRFCCAGSEGLSRSQQKIERSSMKGVVEPKAKNQPVGWFFWNKWCLDSGAFNYLPI
ncbi:hypothetical protein DUQ00_15185 [Salmonella bongori]|uniref:Uncharacterized protein n=3 Tax=Salmonella bongori TaxID=54736 RepID=S5N382_SALBN|nr:hypothetical protein A464_4321 [Salmonella bongori N268-08]AID27719.1 hypothetical protein N643_19025 [Salmonella bongori serovar 48:z41:-- str. RKS3044]ASG56303.1 hypothetical protein LFZ56_19760 [Salmonella bongori serovar 66:z41:- str. SA19983605]ECC8734377.1 hypothetical protein [Salmonella bongori]ECG8261102.1 hypothetical protein [Salmonella bongori serovar 48:i:-]HAC6696183.1 hypothetical protein [Salmonella bongori serovar 44:r:-]